MARSVQKVLDALSASFRKLYTNGAAHRAQLFRSADTEWRFENSTVLYCTVLYCSVRVNPFHTKSSELYSQTAALI